MRQNNIKIGLPEGGGKNLSCKETQNTNSRTKPVQLTCKQAFDKDVTEVHVKEKHHLLLQQYLLTIEWGMKIKLLEEQTK